MIQSVPHLLIIKMINIKGGRALNIKNNISKLYIILFFHNLIPAYVIERLFYEQRGMTVIMVVLCEIVYAVTIVILEIPTGILADKFGRKPMLVTGAMLAMFEFVILLFANQLWVFLLVTFLAGVSSACTSGSLHALLYDSLIMIKCEKSFETIIGRLNAIDFIGAIIAALSGSILANFYGFEFNYVLSAISMFLAFIVTILLVEPSITSSEGVDTNYSIKEYFLQSITFMKGNPRLLLIMIHAMAIGSCIKYLDEFWQLYLDEIGYSILFFGVFSAIISLARIPGNLIAGYLVKYMKEETIITSILGSCVLGFIIAAGFQNMVGIVAIIFIFIASGVVEPVILGYLHHNTKSEIRATVESIQSLIERTLSFIFGIGFGIISSKINIIAGFAFLGFITLIFFSNLILIRLRR